MQTQHSPEGRVRRTVNELVMAEMFLVQATIESATVIGDGITELGRQISQRDEAGHPSWDAVAKVLQRIADDALEPYSSRFKYFRDMISSDN